MLWLGSKHVPSLKQPNPAEVGPHERPANQQRQGVIWNAPASNSEEMKNQESVDQDEAPSKSSLRQNSTAFRLIGGYRVVVLDGTAETSIASLSTWSCRFYHCEIQDCWSKAVNQKGFRVPSRLFSCAGCCLQPRGLGQSPDDKRDLRATFLLALSQIELRQTLTILAQAAV